MKKKMSHEVSLLTYCNKVVDNLSIYIYIQRSDEISRKFKE